MLGGENKEKEKEYYKTVKTSVSSRQGHSIHSQDKGQTNGIQPVTASERTI